MNKSLESRLADVWVKFINKCSMLYHAGSLQPLPKINVGDDENPVYFEMKAGVVCCDGKPIREVDIKLQIACARKAKEFYNILALGSQNYGREIINAIDWINDADKPDKEEERDPMDRRR